MDPNTALTNLRDAIGLSTALSDGDPVDYTAEQILADMTEAASALDGWLTNGGFLPADWTAKALCWTDEDGYIVHQNCAMFANGTITDPVDNGVIYDPNGA